MQQPQPYDSVDNRIAVGVAGGAFKANFEYRIHEGHDDVTGSFMAGDGTGGHGQFQIVVDVAGAAFQLERLFVEVFPGAARTANALPSRLAASMTPQGPNVTSRRTEGPGCRNFGNHLAQSGCASAEHATDP